MVCVVRDSEQGSMRCMVEFEDPLSAQAYLSSRANRAPSFQDVVLDFNMALLTLTLKRPDGSVVHYYGTAHCPNHRTSPR